MTLPPRLCALLLVLLPPRVRAAHCILPEDTDCPEPDTWVTPPAPLTDKEWHRYLNNPSYEQPKWPRNDDTMSTAHLLLQRAASMHQKGDLDKTIQILKNLLQKAGGEYHGEAYAALSKVLHDQGKHELADRAMAKATRINNDGLADWHLF